MLTEWKQKNIVDSAKLIHYTKKQSRTVENEEVKIWEKQTIAKNNLSWVIFGRG